MVGREPMMRHIANRGIASWVISGEHCSVSHCDVGVRMRFIPMESLNKLGMILMYPIQDTYI